MSKICLKCFNTVPVTEYCLRSLYRVLNVGSLVSVNHSRPLESHNFTKILTPVQTNMAELFLFFCCGGGSSAKH